MNKKRRNELTKLISRLETVDSILEKDELEDIIFDLEEIRDEEEEAFDNMPENLQGSWRGSESEEAIDNMDSAIEALEDACDEEDADEFEDMISDAIGYIEDAVI